MRHKIEVNHRSIQVLRIAVSGIFIIAGINHLIETDQTVDRIAKSNFNSFAYFFGNPTLLVLLSGIGMLIAGLLFLIGYKTKWMALLLICILIPITITVQTGQTSTLGPLFKNIAILGGLLFFVLNDTHEITKK